MTVMEIFFIQFLFSLIVFSFLAWWYLTPWLGSLSPSTALSVLLLPHVFRHIGMSFLVPNLNSGGLPQAFANSAGYGDLISAVLALVALLAVRYNAFRAVLFVWLFNIVGTIDLANALRQTDVINYFGATWFIPTFFVPILLVSHWMIFWRLLSRQGVRPSWSSAS